MAVRRGTYLAFVVALPLGGCASFSAKITGSGRSGSEQILLTGAADRAISCVDFRPLSGASVFLDASRVTSTDAGWVAFGLRRAMARQGLLLVEERRDAQVIVEAAVAAYGTDEVDCRVSTPGLTSFELLPFVPTSADPHAFGRKSRQDAVVRLALAGYDAKTRRLVWESGDVQHEESLDRRFIGTHEITRATTLPALERYPRR